MEQCFVLAGRIPSKKNSRINTRSGRSFPSRDYANWHREAMAQLRLQLATAEAHAFDLFKVDLEISFPTLGRADLTNKADSVMDLLVDAGILPDDSWTCVPYLNLSGRKDAACPGAVVRITGLYR